MDITSGLFGLLGTLVGAFVTTRSVAAQARIHENREKRDRDRDRIERIYRLLKELYVAVEAMHKDANKWADRLPEPDGCARALPGQYFDQEEKSVSLVSEIATLQQLYFPELDDWQARTAVLVATQAELCRHLMYDVRISPIPLTQQRAEQLREKRQAFSEHWRQYLNHLQGIIEN